MVRLEDIQILLHTAQLGSLSAAARALDISPAVASAALKRLELAGLICWFAQPAACA
jgi:DNA-binding transcriptional LysR family regulator